VRRLRDRSPVLVAEQDPEEGAETGEEEQGAVEEDVPALCNQAVFEQDENAPEESGACAAAEFAESKVGDRNERYAEDGWEESHGNVWDVGWVLGTDIFEVEGPIEPKHERG